VPHPDWWDKAEPGIHAAISDFSEWMQNKVATIRPYQLIVKNPYLFRARSPESADQLAARLIEAFLSSSEETRFGDILEETAIAICRAAKGGWKSSADGIDLEYDENGIRTIMQIKSGTNWGNSSQRKKLVADFQSATRTLRQGSGIQVRCVEGICYGPSGIKDYGSHIRLVGNDFWQGISGWPDTGRAVLQARGSAAPKPDISFVPKPDISICCQHQIQSLTAGTSASHSRIRPGKVYEVLAPKIDVNGSSEVHHQLKTYEEACKRITASLIEIERVRQDLSL